MSDPRGHDHDPDQAALDELMRAFADDAPADDVTGDESGDGDHADEPELEPTAPTPAPEPLTIIEIDDDSGTTEVEPVEPAEPEPARVDPEPADRPVVVDPGLSFAAGSSVHDDDDDADGFEDVDGADGSGDDGPDPASPATVVRIDDFASDASELGEPVVDGLDPLVTEHPDRVVIDHEDDLPDPIYVEGSLDQDGSRSIVFIEDDDTGDALVPESDRDLRRGIEPRMRERRLAVRRAAGRKRLKWVALAAAILAIGVGTLAVLGSSLFAVEEDQVTVIGNVYTDPDALEEIVDDLVGTPVLRVDTAAAERDLEAIPWVDEAVVRTDFPHSATIDIREREAMTTYQGPDGRFRVLDRDGRVLDVLDKYPFAYLLLGGPDPVDLEPGEFAPRGYAAASDLTKALTGSVRGQVEMIEITADGSRLVMRLDDGTEVRFGEARDILAKLVRLETVLSSDEGREPGVIDVSTSEVTL